jgi:hypothetical protein
VEVGEEGGVRVCEKGDRGLDKGRVAGLLNGKRGEEINRTDESDNRDQRGGGEGRVIREWKGVGEGRTGLGFAFCARVRARSAFLVS